MQTHHIDIGQIYAYMPPKKDFEWNRWRVFRCRVLAVLQPLELRYHDRYDGWRTVRHENGVQIYRFNGYEPESTDGKTVTVLPNTIIEPWDSYRQSLRNGIPEDWKRSAARTRQSRTASEMARRFTDLTGAEVRVGGLRATMTPEALAIALGTIEGLQAELERVAAER